MSALPPRKPPDPGSDPLLATYGEEEENNGKIWRAREEKRSGVPASHDLERCGKGEKEGRYADVLKKTAKKQVFSYADKTKNRPTKISSNPVWSKIYLDWKNE
ncbi:Hypothetical protein FKW44_023824 [Caligus rogercresseyi]|uniref:Uncharacterized protein n=1 Tax=Caligus rogercresseyi TaxID=217165 RepID=A0A7T8JVN2_CALRO|nr:Hypothetical protein FKW44_023824 [Caligus rogercresseyi]